jgi:hypothetical protein
MVVLGGARQNGMTLMIFNQQCLPIEFSEIAEPASYRNEPYLISPITYTYFVVMHKLRVTHHISYAFLWPTTPLLQIQKDANANPLPSTFSWPLLQ